MAKIKIQGNASGTGVITLEAPNTNTDRTITLPDGDISLGVGIDDNATSTAITIDASEKVTFDNDIDTRYTRVNNGGAGTAAFGFNGDTDTGLFLPSANTLAVTTGGSEAARFLSSGGITFNGDTAAANALDDYEEGTWTPTLNNTGGSPSYTWQKGHYVKVGAWVWLTANVKFTVTPSGATQQAVGGLPFANRSGAGQYTAAMFTPKRGFAYDGDGLTADIYDGSTIAYLEEYIAGTGGNGGSLLANEIGTTVEFRFSTFYTTS